MLQADIPTGTGLPIKRKLLELYNIHQKLSEEKANNPGYTVDKLYYIERGM